MKLIKRHYEEGYHDNPFTFIKPDSQRNYNRLNFLLEHVSSGRLLAVGCGKGSFLILAERHFDVSGIDISRTAIAAIRPHFGDRVSQFNVEQRPLPRSDYQAITAFNVLEHLRQPDKTVDKIYRSLLPGGVLFGSVPNNFGPVGKPSTWIENIFDRTHLSTFSPDTWRRIIRHAGFRRVDFFGEITFGPNHSRYLRGKSWPYFSTNLMFLCTRL